MEMVVGIAVLLSGGVQRGGAEALLTGGGQSSQSPTRRSSAVSEARAYCPARSASAWLGAMARRGRPPSGPNATHTHRPVNTMGLPLPPAGFFLFRSATM